jgi:hypothetical protein
VKYSEFEADEENRTAKTQAFCEPLGVLIEAGTIT